MNIFECEVYIFGTTHTIYIKTNHTLEELESDWSLREKLIGEELLKDMIVQSHIEQI